MTTILPCGTARCMINVGNLPGLEGLLNLDRQGVDIRPTLLRVITDQYLQSAIHTPDEERQFTKLALRLIDESDIATRSAVARRLAHHSSAPRPIILQLARDVLEVAEPILLHSSCLLPADLDTIAAEGGLCCAEIVARRRQLEKTSRDAAARQIGERSPSEVEKAHAAERSIASATAADLIDSANAQACELRDLFFAANAEERRLVLVTLDCVPVVPIQPPSAMQRSDVWRLESAALQHNTETVVRDLERALRISRRLARRIVNDELGEPMVVVAKATAIPADVLQRMLLCLNPRIGQTVDRVYQLAALCGDITVEAAHRLVDS